MGVLQVLQGNNIFFFLPSETNTVVEAGPGGGKMGGGQSCCNFDKLSQTTGPNCPSEAR